MLLLLFEEESAATKFSRCEEVLETCFIFWCKISAEIKKVAKNSISSTLSFKINFAGTTSIDWVFDSLFRNVLIATFSFLKVGKFIFFNFKFDLCQVIIAHYLLFVYYQNHRPTLMLFVELHSFCCLKSC